MEFDATDLVQCVPEYEEVNVIDIREYDQRVFETFKLECEQDIQKMIKEMNTLHVEFSGHM